MSRWRRQLKRRHARSRRVLERLFDGRWHMVSAIVSRNGRVRAWIDDQEVSDVERLPIRCNGPVRLVRALPDTIKVYCR